MDHDNSSGKRFGERRRGGAGKRVQIVVTPGSGDGRALRTASRIHRLVRRQGWEANLQSFRDLTPLLRWAKTCSPEFAYLICVGGTRR